MKENPTLKKQEKTPPFFIVTENLIRQLMPITGRADILWEIDDMWELQQFVGSRIIMMLSEFAAHMSVNQIEEIPLAILGSFVKQVRDGLTVLFFLDEEKDHGIFFRSLHTEFWWWSRNDVRDFPWADIENRDGSIFLKVKKMELDEWAKE